MYITKRDGTLEKYNELKIVNAIKAAFKECNSEISEEHLNIILSNIKENKHDTVESVQDLIEVSLMKLGYYTEAKKYIIYREEHSKTRELFNELSFGNKDILRIFKNLKMPELTYLNCLNKFKSFSKPNLSEEDKIKLLTKAALECTTELEPNWEFVAARLLGYSNKQSINKKVDGLGITNFYSKLKYMTDRGLFNRDVFDKYSEEEINTLEQAIVEERDNLLTYSALDLLVKRYTICDFNRENLETPQEMFMGIAMHIENEVPKVIELYNTLSQLKATMATPTIANARKPHYQMSSCFIDTVPDSLDGIYRSITNFANVSKMGGGMGLYFGKVRSAGSDIRGFKGAAGGVIRWIRLANDTAVAVDQLGVRAGSVACYLDVWHKDILDFLQLKTNNGDDRMKAHDIFPAVCYPDLFWKMVEEDMSQDWYLLCPHEVHTIKGYCLEDYYGEEWEKRYRECVEDDRIPKNKIQIRELVRLILRSAFETGTPFAFFRDTVNRANPNKHAGMIYSSNLCVEITQNMSPIEHIQTTMQTEDGDTIVVQKTKPGDFVVCNLASLVLSRINFHDEKEVEQTLSTIIRALDSVIDRNLYPSEYARFTNQQYRPLGLGAMGYHHYLALNGIAWESDAHLKEMDRVFELINFYAIKASMELAKELGAYPKFKGSDWETGEYFKLRGYTSKKWQDLAADVKKYGMRNGYLMAIAPTGSTSVIAGTTATVDPVMNKYFLEEKKGSIIPRVAPDLNDRTVWLYKNAYNVDQVKSIVAAGVRQRHIDQSQSTNLYITTDYSMGQILNLYKEAWKNGLKTVYYVRSKSLEVEECESCAS